MIWLLLIAALVIGGLIYVIIESKKDFAAIEKEYDHLLEQYQSQKKSSEIVHTRLDPDDTIDRLREGTFGE